jgi:hypothetical protein
MSWFFNMYDSNMHGERVKIFFSSLGATTSFSERFALLNI